MLLQDTRGKDSNEFIVTSNEKSKSLKSLLLHSLLFLILITCCSLLVTVVFAQQPSQQQQPAAHQKSLEEERLAILKADIKKEIERLEKLKKEIEEVQKALDIKIQEGLLKVAKMYEAMPPEEAARKLEKLDEDAAVIILNSLKPKTAGKILAQMDNDKAASLSKKILIKGKVLQEKTSQ
jgi:flagellar motility protein MotE (MotC chaperone)